MKVVHGRSALKSLRQCLSGGRSLRDTNRVYVVSGQGVSSHTIVRDLGELKLGYRLPKEGRKETISGYLLSKSKHAVRPRLASESEPI